MSGSSFPCLDVLSYTLFRWKKEVGKERWGEKGLHFLDLVDIRERKLGWYGWKHFPWGPHFCYHPNLDWERERERDLEVILTFSILKLPICTYILLTSHKFKVVKVKTFIFLSFLFEMQTREIICFLYFPSYIQTQISFFLSFHFSFPRYFLFLIALPRFNQTWC